MIGSIIDKYEVLQKLGEGATATVYRGRHLTIGKDVAIKVLHPHLSASSRYRERFNREARAVGRLSHQNIVSILDYSGQQADDCYIVTELIDGVTLLALLQEVGRLPSEIAAVLGMDLCSALAFAHQQGVIHRDIKPENVMVRRDGRVKLMDFGVARVLDEGSITLDGSLLGSPAYMSPQQAMDEPLDGRSDLFSLGTVLFHSVTGHVPFAGSNASVILRNIIEGNRPEVLELAPQASPALAAVIDRLLQPRPEDRYPSAEAVRDALGVCLEEVRLGPDHPVVSPRTYLVNPSAAEQALEAHLRTTLLEVGKERLAKGEQLGALQLFNRLLAVDDENEEVIALIQSLHQGPDTRRRPRWIAFGAAVAVLVCGAGAWGWWSTRDEPPPPARAHVEPGESDGAVEPAPPAAAPDETPGTLEAEPPSSVATVVAMAEPTVRRAVRAPVVRGESPKPAAAGPDPAAQEPARLVIELEENTWAKVRVDGKDVGGIRMGGASSWVATAKRPLELLAGEHVVELENPSSEPWQERVVLTGGQTRKLTVKMRRLKATVNIKPDVPRDCEVAVNGTPYGTLPEFKASFGLDAGATAEVYFRCPGKAEHMERIEGLKPGAVWWIPKTLPAGWP